MVLYSSRKYFVAVMDWKSVTVDVCWLVCKKYIWQAPADNLLILINY
jgi:hypothetical protein